MPSEHTLSRRRSNNLQQASTTPRHPDPTDETLQAAVAAARAADDKKALDVVILDVGETLGVVEYFVIASGTNDRQVRTIVDTIEERLRRGDGAGGGRAGRTPKGREGIDAGRWALLDYGDLVVHVFLDDVRRFYDLERLWADAPRVAWESAGASS